MKNLGLIIFGTLAVVLIGMAVWQLMWMSDVVDNYDAAKYLKRPDLKVNIEENTFQDQGATVIPDHPAEEEATVVPEGSTHVAGEEVTDIAVKESQAVLNKPESTIKDADRNDRAPSRNEQVTIRPGRLIHKESPLIFPHLQ